MAILRKIKIPTIPQWMRRRIGFSIIVLMAAIVINFILPRAMPGDITYYVTGPEMPPEVAEAILKRLGLDKPIWDQFLIYLRDTFTLDFGYSFRFSTKPVISIIGETLPRTLILRSSVIVGSAECSVNRFKTESRRGSSEDITFTGSRGVVEYKNR